MERPLSEESRPGDESSRFVEGIRNGDPATIQWIRTRCLHQAAPRFSRWAWDWIADDFVADLLTQLTVTFSAEDFELRGTFRTYVDCSIANLCKRYFGTVGRLRRVDSLDERELDVPLPTRIDVVAVALDLRRALRTMDEPCRRLLIQKYVEGMRLDEIATELGIEPKTARSRLHSCRQRLRLVWRRLTAERE